MEVESLIMLYEYMINTNPVFKEYAESYEGKTWKDVAYENNILIPKDKAE